MDSYNITTLEQRIIEQVQKRLEEIKTSTDRGRLSNSFTRSNMLTMLIHVEDNGLSVQASKKLEDMEGEVYRFFSEAVDRIDKKNYQRSIRIGWVLIGSALGLSCLLFT